MILITIYEQSLQITVCLGMGKAIMWFRRDLRLEDNHALHQALTSGNQVIPIFIFDQNILEKLDDEDDARVSFIYDVVFDMKSDLNKMGSDLKVYYGRPIEIMKNLISDNDINAIYYNRDYEGYALERDKRVKEICNDQKVLCYSFKDHVIFEGDEILKDDGDPYVVFTPYSRKWKEKLELSYTEEHQSVLSPFQCKDHYDNFFKTDPSELISMDTLGFVKSSISFPSKTVNQGLIKSYDKKRDYPYIQGTSRLGIHFRFGTISIRDKALKSKDLNEVFLNELIWRDFYSMILQHFPRVEKESFRKQYDLIEWRNNEEEFELWCEGKTGYPLVDAGMRELNTTGYMHNRVRMVVASFLTKHLLIDWRWGEAYFARRLLDYDLASNNGGWQWAAGCGTDAAPYFRIFNPTSQQKKYDPEMKYIEKFVTEYGTPDYPDPIVDHKYARERCLETYKSALNN